ncbi:hypothetical protein B5G50_04300 [Brevibacillus brevis]|uniref:insecticidal delta-endotoxin Cry8Ea1 family protein n=1 Tax=Brevibacillus brevis TaxID=1393 RepID=UPI000B3782E1|nr:insecticidal delta-endotoxin Cry8Ea1 family protein [Brevibacillus brevis]OUQ89282.1 hypothetical protein B5G50_04300 [Brevibacillus brevis]
MQEKNLLSTGPYNTLSTTAYQQLNNLANKADGFDWEQLLKDVWHDVYNGQITRDYLQLATDNNIDYRALVTTILSYASSFVPFVGPVIGFFIPIIDLIWPPSQPDLFDILRQQIQDLINQALTTDTLNKLQALLQGWKNELDVLATEVKNLTDPKTSTIGSTVNTIHLQFVHDIPQFTLKDYAAYALPLYIQAATMHLGLLKEAISKQTDWGISDSDKTNFLTYLKQWIVKHSENVYTLFVTGLQNIQDDESSQISSAEFIYTSTLYGFDIAALWPTFDKWPTNDSPEVYPTQTDIEQTRFLFSDLVGRVDWRGYPSAGDPSTYLYGNFPGELTQISTRTWDRVDQIQQVLDRGYNQAQTYTYGDSGGAANDPINISRDNPLIGVTPRVMSPYVGIMMDFADGTSITNGGSYGYDKRVVAPDNHKVHFVFPWTDELGGQDAVMNAFVFKNLYSENVIGQSDPTTGVFTIKGIPAEKGYIEDGSSLKVVQERLNGTNAVQLPLGPSLVVPITNKLAGQYHIRVRYANPSDSSIDIWQSVNAGKQTIQGGNFTFPSTKNVQDQGYVPGQNGNYMLLTISLPDPISLPLGEIDVRLGQYTSQTRGNLFIDRIEFVPVPAPVTLFSNSYSVYVPFGLPASQTLWSGNTINSQISIEGTADPDSDSGVLQFYQDSTLQKQIDIPGSGQNYKYPNTSIPNGFNKIILSTNHSVYNGIKGTMTISLIT